MQTNSPLIALLVGAVSLWACSAWAQVNSETAAPLGDIFKVGNGVTAPSIITRVEPTYTEEALKAKAGGEVGLSLIIDTEGKARAIRAYKPLGFGLDENAIAAVKKWKFRPGMKDGHPVNVFAAIQVNFSLAATPVDVNLWVASNFSAQWSGPHF